MSVLQHTRRNSVYAQDRNADSKDNELSRYAHNSLRKSFL